MSIEQEANPENSAPEEHLGETPVDSEITDNSEETTEDIEDEAHGDGKQHKGFQKRIDRFNRKISSQEQEIQYLKSLVNSPKQIENDYIPQESNQKPTLNDFGGDVEAYTEALTEYKIQQKEINEKQKTVIENFKKREETLRKADPDYDDIIQDFSEKYKSVKAPEINQFISDSEIGPELFYHLANNHDVVEKLLKLSPVRRLGELGKIEDKLEAKYSKTVQEPNRVSKAPVPVSKENGKTVTIKGIDDPDISQAEYRRLRASKRT